MQVWVGQYLVFTGSMSEPLPHASLGEWGINGRQHPSRQRGDTEGMEHPDAQSSSSVLPVSSWTARHCHRLLCSSSWAVWRVAHTPGQVGQGCLSCCCPLWGDTSLWSPHCWFSISHRKSRCGWNNASASWNRLGRWAVLYKLEWLFAPALPPGTRLPVQLQEGCRHKPVNWYCT